MLEIYFFFFFVAMSCYSHKPGKSFFPSSGLLNLAWIPYVQMCSLLLIYVNKLICVKESISADYGCVCKIQSAFQKQENGKRNYVRCQLLLRKGRQLLLIKHKNKQPFWTRGLVQQCTISHCFCCCSTTVSVFHFETSC